MDYGNRLTIIVNSRQYKVLNAMKNRTERIPYSGIEIYYIDLSGLKDVQDYKVVIDKAASEIRSQPLSSVYTMTNITGMRFNSDVKDLIVQLVKGNKPYVKAGAVVGVSGLLRIMFNGIMRSTGRNLKAVKSLQEAKDWVLENA